MRRREYAARHWRAVLGRQSDDVAECRGVHGADLLAGQATPIGAHERGCTNSAPGRMPAIHSVARRQGQFAAPVTDKDDTIPAMKPTLAGGNLPQIVLFPKELRNL